jgi:hypothetical protein
MLVIPLNWKLWIRFSFVIRNSYWICSKERCEGPRRHRRRNGKEIWEKGDKGMKRITERKKWG